MSSRTSIQRAANMLSRQVQWQHPMVVQGSIDQTRLSIYSDRSDKDSDSTAESSAQGAFSFVVMGDTDFGESDGWSQSQFAEMFAGQMAKQVTQSQLLLHTGDVTYPIGSYQNYSSGFLQPYQFLISKGLNKSDRARGSDLSGVVFDRPVLPVPGNHDYAQLPFWPQLRQRLAGFVYNLLSRVFCFRASYRGGQGGEAYGRIFLDDLEKLSPEALKHHLIEHYSERLDRDIWIDTEKEDSEAAEPAYCLEYVPGQFTRLPNRYYTFSYQDIDFFALDSNTWSSAEDAPGFDRAQLDWLEDGLVQSWRSPNSLGRIIYLHHSPYTTERTRWQQSETLWVRRHLRQVLDNVKARLASEVDLPLDDRPLVDLVISGHAHCLEHIKTMQTGHGDAHIDWLVCGGSGLDVRRQRSSGNRILESLTVEGCRTTEMVAKSVLYAGVHGEKETKQRFHSFVRIDVPPGDLRRLVIHPFVVAKGRFGWQTNALDPIVVGGFLKSRTQFRDRKSQGRRRLFARVQ